MRTQDNTGTPIEVRPLRCRICCHLCGVVDNQLLLEQSPEEPATFSFGLEPTGLNLSLPMPVQALSPRRVPVLRSIWVPLGTTASAKPSGVRKSHPAQLDTRHPDICRIPC